MEDIVHKQLKTYLLNHDVHKVLVICDEKLVMLYPDYFEIQYFKQKNIEFHFFYLPATESQKSMNTVMLIFDYLIENEFDKGSLIINWGGGIISDIGGFVAAFYKRGLRLINIPTTLLAMVDAAHGGKNGVNFHHIKNGLGAIYFPDQVILNSQFLDTLPNEEFLSGLGELIKSVLLGIPTLWNDIVLKKNNIESLKKWVTDELIQKVADFKNRIVEMDPQDQGIRQILNFGHTIGHALESYYMNQKMEISHGKAVAIGLYYETRLSHHLGFLHQTEMEQITAYIQKLYSIPVFSEEMVNQLIPLIHQDKKNRSGIVKVTVLNAIGDPVPSISVREDQLKAILLN
jgi:3-dehydroquinate synthase